MLIRVGERGTLYERDITDWPPARFLNNTKPSEISIELKSCNDLSTDLFEYSLFIIIVKFCFEHISTISKIWTNSWIAVYLTRYDAHVTSL